MRYEYQTRFHTNPNFYTQPILANGQFAGKVGLATGSNGMTCRPRSARSRWRRRPARPCPASQSAFPTTA